MAFFCAKFSLFQREKMFAIFCAYLLSMQADQVFHNSQFRIVQQVLGKFAQTCFRKLRKNLIIARNYFRNLLKIALEDFEKLSTTSQSLMYSIIKKKFNKECQINQNPKRIRLNWINIIYWIKWKLWIFRSRFS